MAQGCIQGSLQWKCSGEVCEDNAECETNECLDGICTYSKGLTWWAVVLLIIFSISLILLFLVLAYSFCYRKITEYNKDEDEVKVSMKSVEED